MAIQLERQRDTCEAILAHSDFAKVCEDANMLVMEFGMYAFLDSVIVGILMLLRI